MRVTGVVLEEEEEVAAEEEEGNATHKHISLSHSILQTYYAYHESVMK